MANTSDMNASLPGMQSVSAREMQLAWEDERARYDALFAFMPMGLLTLDAHGQITEVNGRAAAILGARRQELLGRAMLGFVGSLDQALWRGLVAKAWEGLDTPAVAMTLIGPLGAPARVTVECMPAQPGSTCSRLTLVLSDQAGVQSDHLAELSHELRAPASAIVGLMDLVSCTSLSSTQQLHIDMARSSAETLLKLVNRTLDAASLASGQVGLEAAPFALDDVLNELLASVAHQAQAKGIAFVLDRAPEVPARLVGDALRLGQVLMNLCVNAIKFTEVGQVSLEIRRLPNAASDQARLRFDVRDTGMGIAAHHLPRLFKPFAQADASIARTHGGTGLGLSICKQIVDRMQGEMEVTSQVGVGSSFAFTVAFDLAEAEAEACATDALAEPLAHELKGKRVLAVDDCPINQLLITELLTKSAGMSVVIATTGQEALQRVCEDAFDVVLMDLHLPDMDGLQATALIRQDARFQTLPIMALTAERQTVDKPRCLAAGMNDLLTKPFLVPDLLNALTRCLFVGEMREVRGVQDVPKIGPALEAYPGPGVDIEQGLRYCCGNRALLQRVAQRFVRSRAQDGTAIAAALDRGDTETAAQLAHRQISSASIIGAAALAGTARAFQNAIVGGEKSAWPALLRQFEQQLAAALADLHHFLALRSTTERPAPTRQGRRVQGAQAIAPGNHHRQGNRPR